MQIGNIIGTKNILKIIRNSLTVCFLLFTVQIITVMSLHNDNVKEYEKKLNLILSTEGLDLNLMCNVLSCKYVVYDGTTFLNKDGILVEKVLLSVDEEVFLFTFNKKLETIINLENSIFIVDNDIFIDIVSSMIFITCLIIFIIFTIMFTLIFISESKRNIMEKSILKNNLETRLQRDMTESLHHEMGTPIAVIKTLIEDLYKNILPCNHTKDKICRHKTFREIVSACYECPLYQNKNDRKLDKIASLYYEKIILNIESLNALQTIIGNSKHIKYSNGTVSLLEIIVNVISSSNSSKVNKVDATYKDKDLFNSYACGLGLQNGELLLVMNAMINNCIEAKSTKITFSAELNNDEKLDIFVQDNGRGIRDRNGNLVNDINIFNYGYSTKQKNGECLQPMTFVEKMVNKYFTNNINLSSERGVGLSVNKRILNKSGGDITLVNTSELGTLFKVTIPIKLRKKK